jgi:hypothetical protein
MTPPSHPPGHPMAGKLFGLICVHRSSERSTLHTSLELLELDCESYNFSDSQCSTSTVCINLAFKMNQPFSSSHVHKAPRQKKSRHLAWQFRVVRVEYCESEIQDQNPEILRNLAPFQIFKVPLQCALNWHAKCCNFFQPGAVKIFVNRKGRGLGSVLLHGHLKYTKRPQKSSGCFYFLVENRLNNVFLMKVLNNISFWYIWWGMRFFYFRPI